jgi:hypothetical protein
MIDFFFSSCSLWVFKTRTHARTHIHMRHASRYSTATTNAPTDDSFFVFLVLRRSRQVMLDGQSKGTKEETKKGKTATTKPS